MILLTGGSGFIGSHFHRYLQVEQVVNLDLLAPAFGSKSTFVQGDIRVKADVLKAVKGRDIECIISLAAKHHDFGIGHAEYFDTNEDGTRVICEVAAEQRIKRIIFFSSVAVYGIRDQVSTEEMEPRPDSPYGASKLAGEKVLEKWVQQDPSREVVVVRPTLVFGPQNMANMRNLIRQIDSGFYFHLGKADNVKSIAYVENVVQATLYLKGRMTPGFHVFNYADEPQMSTKAISETIAHALGRKIRLTIPKTLGVMMGIPFDVLIKITGRNFPISTARIKKLSTETYHSAKRIFSIGFRPEFSSTEGLRKMVEWYKTGNGH
jgi:nucleoside-diphosphate-sugar epimerase